MAFIWMVTLKDLSAVSEVRTAFTISSTTEKLEPVTLKNSTIGKIGKYYSVAFIWMASTDSKVRTIFKGVLSRIISISLKSQNIYLSHRKSTNNGLFFVTNCYISMLELLANVFGCRWPGWKRIATWKIEANFSSCFHASSENRYLWLWYAFSLRIEVIYSFRCSKIMFWMD